MQTIKGQVYTVIDDELILEDDPRGEEKIDADGVLLGGELGTSLNALRYTQDALFRPAIQALLLLFGSSSKSKQAIHAFYRRGSSCRIS